VSRVYRNGLAYYRQKGLVSLLKAMSSRLGFEWQDRPLTFLFCDLEKLHTVSIPWQRLLQEASPEEIIAEVEYNDGWFTKEQALERIALGHKLFFARRNGKMVYFFWAEMKGATIGWWRCHLSLPEETVYLAAEFTHPEHRHQGLAKTCRVELLIWLREHGYKRAILVVHPKNKVALAMNKKTGFVPYQLAHYKRFLTFRVLTVEDFRSGEFKRIVRCYKIPADIWRGTLFSNWGEDDCEP